MKKLLIILLLTGITVTTMAQSQGFKYGARFAIGQANFNSDNISDEAGKLMLRGGFGATYQFNKNVALFGEGALTLKGSKATFTRNNSGTLGTSTETFEDDYSLVYVELPLMLKLSYGASEEFYIKGFAGPSLNFNVLSIYNRDSNINANDFQQEKIPGVDVIEGAFVFGGGFDIETKQGQIFSLDVRSNKAFSSWGKIPGNGRSGFNNYFAVGVGYTF